jgi:hypothetical protein
MAAINYQDDDFSDPGYGGSMFAPLFLPRPGGLQNLPSYPNNLQIRHYYDRVRRAQLSL